MHFIDLLATLPPALRDYVRELETRATLLEAQAAALEMRTATLEMHAATLEMQASALATLAPDAEEEADKEPKSAGKKRGRKPLPAHLPRQRVEHDLLECEKVCRCCQGALHRMGEETSE